MKSFSSGLFKKFLLLGIVIPLFMSGSLFAADPVRIMPLGDSITYDNNIADVTNPRPDGDRIAYRGPLWSKLVDGGYDFDFVGSQAAGQDYDTAFDPDNEGYPGFRTSDLDVYALLSKNPADIILLHIGTNDVSDNNISAAEANDLLDEIDRFESEKGIPIKVILAQVINRKSDSDATLIARTSEFNDNLKAMADQRIAAGDDIVIVNMEDDAGFAYDDTDMADRLHPNIEGYGKMANLWYSELETILTPATPATATHLWKLEEETGRLLFADDITGGIDGECIVEECPTQTVGQVDFAQDFNGSQKVSVADDDSLDWAADESFSVELWMKPSSPTGLDVAVGHYGGTGNTWWIAAEATHLKFEVGSNSFTTAADTIDTTGTVWTHVVMVKDATQSQVTIYINGVFNSDHPITNADLNGSRALEIGHFFNEKYNFNGALDEIALYDGALTATEIKQHFNDGISENEAPIADAGTVQSVKTGTLTTLDGSASSDADGDDLTYSWSFTSKPAESTAALTNANTVSPTFTSDVDGAYVIQLIVNDGTENSKPDSVIVTASTTPPANTAPVADAGTPQSVGTGTVTTLDGSASSDADGDSLTYSWSFTSKPNGSSATLLDPTADSPTFTPDLDGDYVIQLIVNDGTVNSAADFVTVFASATPPPVYDWFIESPKGTYTTTEGDSIVELDSNLFDIVTSNDMIIFKDKGSDPKVYIKLMSNGEVFTGYIQGGIENPTVASGFAPGTKVSVGADMVLLIDAPLTEDLTFGGK